MAPTVRNISLSVPTPYEALFCPENGNNETAARDVDMYPQARIIEKNASEQKPKNIHFIYSRFYNLRYCTVVKPTA